MIRKCFNGIAWASHCKTVGMFSTGVAKPDMMTIGIATVIRAVVQMKFGPLEKGNLTALPTGTIEVAGTSIRWVDIIVLLVVGV